MQDSTRSLLCEMGLREDEIAKLSLRELYEARGFKKYKMNKFEEYSLYANNKDFIPGDNVLTFTDLDGRVRALRPDVTLSIIKDAETAEDETQRLYYIENVYRENRKSNSFEEIPQVGVEMMGKIECAEIQEILNLAIATMDDLSKDYIMEISNLSFVEGLVDSLGLSTAAKKGLIKLIGEKNTDGVKAFAAKEGVADVNKICELIEFSGDAELAIKKAESIVCNETMELALAELKSATKDLPKDKVRINFSLISDLNYYNGIIFRASLRGASNSVLVGGQYDRAMCIFGKKAKAIGFAFYLDELGKVDDQKAQDEYITVALPKGRLGDSVYKTLSEGGYECSAYDEANRKLVFENEEKKVKYILVKPSDVAVYVEHGAADVGIVGKDILMETTPDVYELKDLGIGKCRMAVAAMKGYVDDPDKVLRVATKFVNTAKKHFNEKNRSIEIIKLHGSIELGPIVGLSDVIVDIVETGNTLRENNLEVVEEFAKISARFIANKTAYGFKKSAIDKMVSKLG